MKSRDPLTLMTKLYQPSRASANVAATISGIIKSPVVKANLRQCWAFSLGMYFERLRSAAN